MAELVALIFLALIVWLGVYATMPNRDGYPTDWRDL